MKPDENKRVRRFAPKSRSGCLTCKGRHVRCDEQKPTCLTCQRIGIRCLGYNQPEPWIAWSADKNSPGAAGKTDTAPTTEKGRDQICPSQIPLDSRISRSLQSVADEPAVITQAYTRLSPHSWDDIYYQLPERAFSFRAEDGTIPWLVTAEAKSYTSISCHSYLAVAASALVLFQPERYPVQLHFKYLHLAVTEIRKSISQSRFDPHELLHSIARILLASVIHHDVVPGRAHLAAAANMLVQLGGIKAVSPHVAALLRYADFHLATVMLCSHFFPLAGMFQASSDAEVEKPRDVDSILTHLCTRLRTDAAATSTTLPPVVIQALHQFSDTVLTLASTISQRPNMPDLAAVSMRIGVLVSLVLRHRPPVIAKDGNCIKRPSQAAPQPRSSPEQHQQQQEQEHPLPPSLDDWTVVLLMWAQILYCCTNAPLGSVSIRTAVLPLLPRLTDGSTDATRTGLSPPVRRGLDAWNERITGAGQTTAAHDGETDDWPSLVDLVASIERGSPVRVAPVMRRLLVVCPARGAIGKGRLSGRRWDLIDESGRVGKTLMFN